jgi:hypothetical protein
MSLSVPIPDEKARLEKFYDLIKDRSYIKRLSDDEFRGQTVDSISENYPWHDLSLDQLKSLLKQPQSTFNQIPFPNTPYNIIQNKDPLDHWVATSMKEWSRELYDSCKGYNKLARLGRAFPFLAKFSKPLVTRKNILSSPKYIWAYQSALSRFKQLMSKCKAETLTVPDMMKQIPGNTGAGYPYFGKKKSEVWSEVHKKSITTYFDLIKGKKKDYHPCILALRGHLSPIEQNKTRSIWIVPFETIVMENVVFRNIYDYVYEHLANTILTGKKTLSRLRQYLNSHSDKDFINLDYSGWDAYRSRFVVIDVFDVFKERIQFKNYSFGSEVGIFYYVRKAFLNSKLLLPDGSCFMKQCGTPSGSLLTALINSSKNFVCLTTVLIALDYDRCIVDLRVLGDDASFYSGVTWVSASDLLKNVAELLKFLFGLVLKPEKCLVSYVGEPFENRKFIGYSLRGSRLFKPEEEFFRSILYPEHEVKNVFISFSRVFSYYLLGGYNHNGFCRFFNQYLGHYNHILSRSERVFYEDVLRQGNLRVIKHVFQIELEQFLKNFDLVAFDRIDFLQIPYFLTLDLPLHDVLD